MRGARGTWEDQEKGEKRDVIDTKKRSLIMLCMSEVYGVGTEAGDVYRIARSNSKYKIQRSVGEGASQAGGVKRSACAPVVCHHIHVHVPNLVVWSLSLESPLSPCYVLAVPAFGILVTKYLFPICNSDRVRFPPF